MGPIGITDCHRYSINFLAIRVSTIRQVQRNRIHGGRLIIPVLVEISHFEATTIIATRQD